MGNITAWYRKSTEQGRKALQRVVCSAEHTIGGALPCLKDFYTRHCKNKARTIIKDPNHLDNGLFSLLRSGKRYWMHQASTERLWKGFYPQATRILNEVTLKTAYPPKFPNGV